MRNLKVDIMIAADRAGYKITQEELEYLLSKEDLIIRTLSFVDLIYFFIECGDNGFNKTIKKYNF